MSRMAAIVAPRPRVVLPAPLTDHRPLTSRVLDVVARAGRPVQLAELYGAFREDREDVCLALDELVRRGRIRNTPTGVAWWQPTREPRPVIPHV